MKNEVLKFDNVTFCYDTERPDHTAVRDLSFSVYEGEFTCILGHNGSGKSTVAKLCNALLLPTKGTVTAYGLDTAVEANENEIRHNVGMVFQNPDNQLVATIVEDDVAFGPENLGLPREEIAARVDEALRLVGMTDFRKLEPHRLSGGQKQRVAIAGALAMQTRCLVLDEPTAMLDPQGRHEVMEALFQLKRELGITVVLVTHFMSEAVAADRVLVMNKGTLCMDGTPREVFTRRDELAAIGLAVPKPLEIARTLRQNGMAIDDALTADELVEAFCSAVQ